MIPRVLAIAVVAWLAAPGHAQAPETRPWAAGVSDAEQAIALELYVAGNVEFTESRFAQALAKYKEAIAHWDHPSIRFNMAVALIHLDQPIEARDHLLRSLVYGAAALGAEAHVQALTYRKLLDAQLMRVTIACREPAATVTLDGKLVLTGPGTTERFVLPGEHQLVATKRGFLTVSRAFAAVAGGSASYPIEPARERDAVRRWARWKPWAVLAGGGALIGLGALSYLSAERGFAAYDRGIAERCPAPFGCSAEMLAGFSDLHDRHDAAELAQRIAFSLTAVGGAVAITGVIGLILNQPRVQVTASSATAVAMRWSF